MSDSDLGGGGAATVDLESLAEAIEQVAALARAGLTGPELWEPLLGPGGDPDRLPAWAAALANFSVGPFAAAIAAVHRVATRAGASTAVLLGSVAEALSESQETADALVAAMAGPRSSARLLQFLPLLGIALGTAMGAQPLRVLFGDGAAALLTGLGLLGAGKLWTAALIRAAARPPSADPLVAAVLAAALRAGLVLPTAMAEVGEAWPGRLGAVLAGAGRGLGHGLSWDDAWSQADLGRRPARSRGWDSAGRRERALGPEAFAERLSPGLPIRTRALPAAVGDREADFAAALRRALRPVWQSGAEAGPLLDGVRQRAARAERRRLNQAAGRLSVHLMAPLGLCYLPAFIALGLVPVVLSFANNLLFTP